jgi:hypothetical protein
MRMKGIRSLRELARILDVDNRIRRICLIKRDEGGYPRSVLSRFTHLVGAEALRLIIEEKVIRLLRRSQVGEVDAVLDACFVKAWSIRDLESNKVGSRTRMRGLAGTGEASTWDTSSTRRLSRS